MEPMLKVRKSNSFNSSKYLNLPDLHFFDWCQRQYGINKGVYNIIDEWFFKHGVVSILARRIQLLAFLEHVKNEGLKHEHHKYIKFGNGGLVKRLQDFYSERKPQGY